MTDRIQALMGLVASRALDGCIIANEKNMFYFTGFSGGSRLFVPLEGDSVIFVYAVNYEAAKEKTQNARVELVKPGEDIERKLADEINQPKIKRIGFDTLAAPSFLKLREYLGKAEIEDADDAVWSLRKVKDDNELLLMKKAAELTSLGMEKGLEIAAVGLRERELAAEIEYEMRKSGSDGVGFDTIVSSGLNSAFPHGGCGDRKIMKGDFVVLDIGAKYQGYCADLTRTLLVGKPTLKQTEIYETVKQAHEKSIRIIKAGIEAREVDAVAREHIAKSGYQDFFVHGLGHGVGLEVHEPPTLGPTSKDMLTSGNIVTVEPGIYIPNLGGVRIEDTVQVLEEAARKLTEAPIAMVP